MSPGQIFTVLYGPPSGTPGANPRQPGSDAPCGLLQAVDFFSAGASCSGVLTVDGSEGAPFDVADQAGRSSTTGA